MYIGIGGWCGTAFGLKGSNLRTHSLPFDWVRSKFEGIIDCLDNNFNNFLPKTYESEKIGKNKIGVHRGRLFSFYHDDFDNHLEIEIEKYERRIDRFQQFLQSDEKITFIRTTVTEDYMNEINLSDTFHAAMNKNYPNTEYRLVFIVPEQTETGFLSKIDEKTYLYTLNDLSHKNDNLAKEYAPIFESLQKFDIFVTKPRPRLIFKINTQSRLTAHAGKPIFIK